MTTPLQVSTDELLTLIGEGVAQHYALRRDLLAARAEIARLKQKYESEPKAGESTPPSSVPPAPVK